MSIVAVALLNDAEEGRGDAYMLKNRLHKFMIEAGKSGKKVEKEKGLPADPIWRADGLLGPHR